MGSSSKNQLFYLIVFELALQFSIPLNGDTRSQERAEILKKLWKSAKFHKYIKTRSVVPITICYPINETVEIPFDTNPQVTTLPRCAVLPRCGGCCYPSQLKCLPKSTTNVNISVNRIYMNKTITIENVSMEVHTACKCQCGVKESDCNTATHCYDESACSCECRNEIQAKSCESSKRKWNRTSCQCDCLHVGNCSEDEVYNYEHCKCQTKLNVALEVIAQVGNDLMTCHLTSCAPGYKPVLVSGVCECRPSSRNLAIKRLLSLLSSPERGHETVRKFSDGKKHLKNSINYVEESSKNSGINDFWKELRNMSRAEFIDKYVNSQSASYSRREDLADIQQGNAQEKPSVRSMSDTTKMIPCYPMNVSVKVPDDPDPNVLTLPLCTVLPRCGGCCEPVPGIKCLPLSTSTVPVTVFRSVNDGQLPLKFSPEILNMEVHTACSCGCSIKPSDCSPKIHNYSSSTCSCRCINENERSNCRTPKKWDETLCRCVCQHLENCLEDEVFNFRTCKCQDLEDFVRLNQRANPAGLSLPAANHLCRPGFTPAVVSGVRVCQPSSLPSNPRSIPPEFPFSRPDQRRRR